MKALLATMTKGLPALALAALLGACAAQTTRTESGLIGVAPNAEAAVLNTRLGIGYMESGNLPLADEKLRRALAQNPNHAPAHLAFAMLQDRLGQTDDADRHYRRAVELDGRDSEAQNTYGVFLCRHHRMAEADAAFARALRNPLYPTPELPLTNAGVCALEVGESGKAENYFRRAVAANPRHGAAILELAELTHDAGRHAEAREWLQHYINVQPQNPRSLWLCVRNERALGDAAAAARCSMRLRGVFPAAPETTLLRELESRDGQ